MIEYLEKKFFKKRQIWIDGYIDDDLAYKVIHKMEDLAFTNDSSISLIINSAGGSVDSEVAIIDEIMAIQTLGIIVSTIVVGVAHSSAATILALGTNGYRYARPNSTIMLHPCSVRLVKDYIDNQKALLEAIDKQNIVINKLIFNVCKRKNFNSFLKEIDKGLWLNAEEAINYGVIDAINNGLLPIGGMI